MPDMLDVFSGDAFGVVSLSAAIDKVPFKPMRITEMGLFTERAVTSTSVMVEERDGALELLPTRARGGPPSLGTPNKRKARSLPLLTIPHEETILADDIQNVRAFGSTTATQSLSRVVADRLQYMRNKHDVTREHLFLGALKGTLLDSDGTTTLIDLFQTFDVTEDTVDFAFSVSTTDIRGALISVARKIETALGGAAYNHVHGLAGDNWFDAYIKHDDVKAAWDRYLDGAFLRSDPRAGFTFSKVTIENYRGKIGSVDFVDTDQCRFFPVGVPDLFVVNYGPADFIETVNTPGQYLYAKQRRLEFDRGIVLHTQSNLLPICTRPSVLIKGTKS